ncbi:hypothetical protein K2173_026246 [Erythroxylum novogranatense]|uniref:Uncharacterized protein n=1 Tax=Erythroxylum novogranatense TaxID=1862640 RepID=A0AAV8SBS7_9ROSI|nr:hypothetical protein K2173_026246 [Erythroxylum novogranatense]
MALTRFFLAISVLLLPLLVSSARDYGYGYGPGSDSVMPDYVPPSVPTPYTAQPESVPIPKNDQVKPDYTPKPSPDVVKSDYTQKPSSDTVKADHSPKPSSDVKSADYTPKPTPDVAKPDNSVKPSSDEVKPADSTPKPTPDVAKPDYSPKPSSDEVKPGYNSKPSKDVKSDYSPKASSDAVKSDYNPKPSSESPYNSPSTNSDVFKPTYSPSAKTDVAESENKPTPQPKANTESSITASKPDNYVPQAESPLPIGIEGLVLCKSGANYVPIQGAVAKITCSVVGQNGYEATSSSCLTDAKGYFFKTLPDLDDDKLKLTDCKAFLESSPLDTCKLPTDVNKGITGAIFSNYRILNDKKIKLFSVGPFFYTSEPASTPGGY